MTLIKPELQLSSTTRCLLAFKYSTKLTAGLRNLAVVDNVKVEYDGQNQSL